LRTYQPRQLKRRPPAAGKPDKAQGIDIAELAAQLRSVVSERTGYPPEMLDSNLDLEADLGIDSITRVEILETLQHNPAAAGVSLANGLMEQLSGARTLQAVIDLIVEPEGRSQPELPEEAPAAEPEAPVAKIERFTVAAVETPLPSGLAGPSPDRLVLVAGGHAVAFSLAAELRRQGFRVAQVRHGEKVRKEEEGSYVADLMFAGFD